ncbi:MAG: nucleoside phosphorylase [Deltaproteobacteria bacterium]|nr:nucleoside phosphorylase [Deltaproteobacteria bacterium]
MTFKSAEQVRTKEGKQYHIGCKPGDLNPFILLCGDPARVERAAKHFKKPTKPICHREFVTVSGNYEGVPVSVMATGMGPDNTEIAVIEICQIVKNPTFIRIGSCGGLKKGVELGDLVVSTGAVRLENTTRFFVHEGYPAVPHYKVTSALIQAASEKNFRFHSGITATAPGFYGAQARNISGFPPRDPDLLNKLAAQNVINIEMEASVLFVLSQLRGVRAGAVCAVYGNRHANKFIDEKTMKAAEGRCIETGLKAVQILSKGTL